MLNNIKRWLATGSGLIAVSPPSNGPDVFCKLQDAEAACAERDARIAELEQQLAEARKDAERWNWLNWHIGVAWGEEGFTSLIRIVSEKHRSLINTQIDKLMSGELPETPAIRAAIKEQT